MELWSESRNESEHPAQAVQKPGKRLQISLIPCL